MVKAMPEPKKHPKTGVYWYRQRCPQDVALAAKGKIATVEIAGERRRLLIGEGMKVSLRTKDHKEAKSRARDVQSQFDLIWASFRGDEVNLSFKQTVALAGEVYRDWKVLEDNPGPPEIWHHARALNADAAHGRPYRHPLTVDFCREVTRVFH